MSRFVLAASLVATVLLAAYSVAPIVPSPVPSPSPAGPSAPPSVAPPSVAPPSVAPPSVAPSPKPPVATPEPPAAEVPPEFTAAERYLLDGVVRGATDCEPAGGSDDLPRDAIAGIECDSDDGAVARIGFYLFGNDADMLDAYFFRMNAEGVARDSGTCYEGEGESAYTPGEGEIPSRNGCFVNDEGFANYRATLPGVHVYIGILGRSGDTRALDAFAWRFNQDVPGNPTLWGEPS
jgi:hypothetical protein